MAKRQIRNQTNSAEARIILRKKNAFISSVTNFLKHSNQLVEVQKTNAPFTSLWLPEKKLNIHCVEIDKQKLNGLPAFYFADFTDAIEKQHHKNIHLYEDIWNLKYEIASLRLLAQIGIQNKIHGRLTNVIKLSAAESNAFLTAHHLQGSVKASYHLGLFYKNDLVAVATFSKSRLMTYESEHYRSYELIRFANKSGYAVVGGFSKLLAAFISEYKVQHLMTYADRDWSNGNSYKKLKFIEVEKTTSQAFYIEAATSKRYFEHRLPSEIMKAFEATKQLNLDSFLEEKGFIKIYNSGNIKFILDLRKNEKQ